MLLQVTLSTINFLVYWPSQYAPQSVLEKTPLAKRMMKQELEVNAEKYKSKVVVGQRGKVLSLITGDPKATYLTNITGQ